MKVCNVNIVQSTLIISSYMFKSVFWDLHKLLKNVCFFKTGKKVLSGKVECLIMSAFNLKLYVNNKPTGIRKLYDTS